MDKEEAVLEDKIFTEGEKSANFTDSSDWKHAKDKLMKILGDANAITGLDDTLDPEKAIVEIQAKKMAIGIVNEWIADIEGTSEGHKNQIQGEKKHETHIHNEEKPEDQESYIHNR